MSARRLDLAEAFLQEAVYRSRANQAATNVLGAPNADAPGGCGLGAEAAIELGLDARGRELFDALFANVDAPALEHVRRVTSDWVERQDALDRKRNHFLKAFRREHGFDRQAYSTELTNEYDAGLAAINDEANRELRAAAAELVGETAADA